MSTTTDDADLAITITPTRDAFDSDDDEAFVRYPTAPVDSDSDSDTSSCHSSPSVARCCRRLVFPRAGDSVSSIADLPTTTQTETAANTTAK